MGGEETAKSQKRIEAISFLGVNLTIGNDRSATTETAKNVADELFRISHSDDKSLPLNQTAAIISAFGLSMDQFDGVRRYLQSAAQKTNKNKEAHDRIQWASELLNDVRLELNMPEPNRTAPGIIKSNFLAHPSEPRPKRGKTGRGNSDPDSETDQ